MAFSKIMQDEILASVGEYKRNGLNVMPVRADGTKAPALSRWKPWQIETVPNHLLYDYFVHDARRNYAIGVICGTTSGDLEILDFDDATIFKPWCRKMVRYADRALHGILGYAPLVETPSGGRHWYYRCEAVGPNEQLAWDGIATEKNPKGEIAIETRGQGGQAVMPGSPPSTHVSGINYRKIGGNWSRIPRITPRQRELLFDVSREFDKAPRVVLKKKPVNDLHTPKPCTSGESLGLTAWDDFDQQAEWEDILLPKGWTDLGIKGNVNYWRRPDKSDPGASATTGHCGDLLHVFSSNATPFAANGTYSKYAALTHLYFDGDFSVSARVLSAKGFGDRDDTEERLAQIIKGN